MKIELPTKLDIVIVPPVPDPSKTTRERFSIHSTDKVCSSCHKLIDPVGFTFEEFDGMGALRAEENGKPVDSVATVALNLDFDGEYASSNALAGAMAESPWVEECFARQLFRASAAEGVDVEDAEEGFVTLWNKLPEDTRGGLLETLVAFTESSLFSHRRAQ